MPIRVSIIEDDDWIRENLAAQLRETEGFVCTGSYRTGEEALEEIPRNAPDVVLMDINLPKMNGIECVRQLKARTPSTQVLMLTVYEDSDRIFNSLLAGASGYLLKRTPRRELLEAIADVHRGNSPMTGHIARKVVQYFNQRGRDRREIEKLSNREQEVLDYLAQGVPYKEIAAELSLSIDTVRIHIKGIYSKLHVHSRGEAVAKYLHNRGILLTPPTPTNVAIVTRNAENARYAEGLVASIGYPCCTNSVRARTQPLQPKRYRRQFPGSEGWLAEFE